VWEGGSVYGAGRKKCFWDERGKVYLGSKGETVSGVRRGKCTVWWKCIVTQCTLLDLLQRN